MDLALFYNDYTRLRSVSLPGSSCLGLSPSCLSGVLFSSDGIRIPFAFRNQSRAENYGLELAVHWLPNADWRVQGSYTLFDSRSLVEPGNEFAHEDPRDPRHQISLLSSWNLRSDLELSAWGRYVARTYMRVDLPGAGENSTVYVPAFLQLDARLAWHPRKNLELSVVGQNLLDGRHPESYSEFGDLPLTEIRRSLYGQIRWSF